VYSTDEVIKSSEKLEVPGVKPVPVPHRLPRATDWELMTNNGSYGKREVVLCILRYHMGKQRCISSTYS